MIAIGGPQAAAAHSRIRSNSRFKAGGESNLRGVKSYRDNISKGIGVLSKHNPLEGSLILRNLYDAGFFDLPKLIDYNLGLLYERGTSNN